MTHQTYHHTCLIIWSCHADSCFWRLKMWWATTWTWDYLLISASEARAGTILKLGWREQFWGTYSVDCTVCVVSRYCKCTYCTVYCTLSVRTLYADACLVRNLSLKRSDSYFHIQMYSTVHTCTVYSLHTCTTSTCKAVSYYLIYSETRRTDRKFPNIKTGTSQHKIVTLPIINEFQTRLWSTDYDHYVMDYCTYSTVLYCTLLYQGLLREKTLSSPWLYCTVS